MENTKTFSDIEGASQRNAENFSGKNKAYSAQYSLEHELYIVPGKDTTELLLKGKPNDPSDTVAVLGVHSSSNGIDLASSDAFGYRGWHSLRTLAEMAPSVGNVLGPVGLKVVVVNRQKMGL